MIAGIELPEKTGVRQTKANCCQARLKLRPCRTGFTHSRTGFSGEPFPRGCRCCRYLVHLEVTRRAAEVGSGGAVGHADAETTARIYEHSQDDVLRATSATLGLVVTSSRNV